MPKRLKTPPNPAFKFIRGRRGRDVIRIDLPSGGVGFVATTIPPRALKAFAEFLARKMAKRKRLARTIDHRSAVPDEFVENDARAALDERQRPGRVRREEQGKMKIWTTYGVYGATGEGETVMACLGHAENAQQAKAAFVAIFGEFFGHFAVAVEGVLRDRINGLLFSDELLKTVEGLEGKATVVAHAKLHINR